MPRALPVVKRATYLTTRFSLIMCAALLLALPGPRAEDEETGPPIAVLAIEGAQALDPAALRRAVLLKEGDVYTPEKTEAAARALRSHARAAGYPEAEAAVRAEPGPDGLRLVFTLREGPLFRYGRLSVEGLKELNHRTIRRQVTFKEGDPYAPSKLFETQSRLYGLGLFETVTLQAATTSARTADITLRVKERPMQWIRGGVGYGSEERQRVSLSYIDENFLRRAYHWETGVVYSAIWLEYNTELVNRYLFGTRTEARGLASWRREYREGYDLERTLGRVSLGRKLSRHLNVEPRYRLQRTIVYDVSPEVGATTPETSLTSAVDTTFSWDDTDNFFAPANGLRAGLTLERSGGFLGGDVHFNRIKIQSAVYEPFWKIVGVLTARGGVVREFGASPEVPIYERLFLGGANTVRGYKERDLGPKDSAENPLGGNVMLGGNAEVRFPIYWRFGGAVFVDGGQVAATAKEAQPSEWLYGGGFGVRLQTPVGPFRLDYGYKLNRVPGDEDLWNIHLSIGEAF